MQKYYIKMAPLPGTMMKQIQLDIMFSKIKYL